MQQIYIRLKSEAAKLGLQINVQKTKWMYVSRSNRIGMANASYGNMTIGQDEIERVDKFTYLGTVMTECNDMQAEIENRIQKGLRAVASMRKMMRSKMLSKRVKLRLYNTIIKPVVTYGSESWTMTLREQRRAFTFENSVLRGILGPRPGMAVGTWRPRTNAEVRELTKQPFLTSTIRAGRLAWLGHESRAGEGRATKMIMNAKPIGKRPLGRPRQRYVDNVMADLERLGERENWHQKTQDRKKWRGIIMEAKTLQELYGHQK